MSGCAYGVGVGPGDPELMTLKAVRILKAVDVITCAGKKPMENTAYKIAVRAVPEIAGKEIMHISSPMNNDLQAMEKEHLRNAHRIMRLLDEGKNVACLTLGDPSIYSSFCYYQRILKEEGYPTETVSGVPSFCAVAARLNISLAEWQEQMHIIPTVPRKEGGECFSGTCVYMKSGKRLKELKDSLGKNGKDVYMVENCGLEGERVCHGIDEIPDQANYFLTVITRERK